MRPRSEPGRVPSVRKATRSRAQGVTWDEFVALPDDDRRELIDGRLVEVEVPTFWHEHIVARLIVSLAPYAKRRRCEILGSGYKVRIDDHRGVMPDVQLISTRTLRTADPNGLATG